MSKIKVGSLFKRPLVVGDPNLVTCNEILVDLDEDNKISSLKERTNEGLSDIVSSDSGSSDDTLNINEIIPTIINLIEPFLNEDHKGYGSYQDDNIWYLSQKEAHELKKYLIPYCSQCDGENQEIRSLRTFNFTKKIKIKGSSSIGMLMYLGFSYYNCYHLGDHAITYPMETINITFRMPDNIVQYGISLHCIEGYEESSDLLLEDQYLTNAIYKEEL